jgi:hypothetical protein
MTEDPAAAPDRGIDEHDRQLRRGQLERNCRRLLALYPRAHRRMHEDEMLGVLVASARPWQRRPGVIDTADLILGALRIRARPTSGPVRDHRWGDALAVASVVAPVLLLVIALARIAVPDAMLSTVIEHSYLPDWQAYLGYWPLAVCAPLLTALAFLRLRRTAGIVAIWTTVALAVTGPGLSASYAYASPGLAAATVIAGLAAAALLLSPGPARGLQLLKWRGIAAAFVLAMLLAALSQGAFASWEIPLGDPVAISGLATVVATAVVIGIVVITCLRTPSGRRFLVLLASPAIPYAVAVQSAAVTISVTSSSASYVGFSYLEPISYLEPTSTAFTYLASLLILALAITRAWRARHPAHQTPAPE